MKLPHRPERPRVLLTGATGFLGQRLVRRLTDENIVTGLGMSSDQSPFEAQVEYLHGDLSNPRAAAALLSPWRWDAVINLAGPVPRDVETWESGVRTVTSHVNIAGNVRLAVPTEWDGRFIHASSMTVYGVPAARPTFESHPRKPIHLYGLGKSLAEDIVWAGPDDVDCWILRLPGIFAESRLEGALYHFMRAAIENRPLDITASFPTPWDILHVDDAVEAFVRALSAPGRRPGAINISYGTPVELQSVAKWMAVHAGTNQPVRNAPGITHPIMQMDIGKAGSLLQWPPTTLQRRLEELWASFSTDR